MAELVLFHHVQGLTRGIDAFANRLRQAGHTVHVPDMFGGRTFDDLEAGMAFARDIGFGVISERGEQAAAALPADLVYAGFSLGVIPAQKLAQSRAGARGALFFHAAMPSSEFGSAWPRELPLQIHAMDRDPFFVDGGDLEAARALLEEADQGEMFLYPGDQHLFTDSSLAAYDAEATDLLVERVLAFLAVR